MDVKVLEEIHRYWFGDLSSPDEPIAEEQVKRWFQPTPEVDAHIRDAWGGCLDEARATDWDMAGLTRPQQMGLIILLDQFPRQVFRTSGEAFAYDKTALAIARQLCTDGGWRRFWVIERTFLFLPFEHSENIADQDRSLLLYAAAACEASGPAVEGCRAALDFATKHRDIIRKFGRFPHRNVMLGRESTPEEIEFLKGGRGF
jgi:uncharacterized protein (DUF924 family)